MNDQPLDIDNLQNRLRNLEKQHRTLKSIVIIMIGFLIIFGALGIAAKDEITFYRTLMANKLNIVDNNNRKIVSIVDDEGEITFQGQHIKTNGGKLLFYDHEEKPTIVVGYGANIPSLVIADNKGNSILMTVAGGPLISLQKEDKTVWRAPPGR